jgi:protein TonB
MTLQVKGFQWSIGIHAAIFIIVAALQISAVSQSKVIVINFALSGSNPPAATVQPLPFKAPDVRHEPKIAKAIRPKEVAAEHNLPDPEAEKAPAPSEAPVMEDDSPDSQTLTAGGTGTLSAQDEAGTPSLSQATYVPGPPTAAGVSRNAVGSAHDRAGLHGNVDSGSTPETSRAAYLREHFAYIRDRVTGSILYPNIARKMGWCGQARIAFIICEDGSVNDVRVVESSGFSLLDRNAVDTVKNAAPFPSPPVKAEIRMAITYRLQ